MPRVLCKPENPCPSVRSGICRSLQWDVTRCCAQNAKNLHIGMFSVHGELITCCAPSALFILLGFSCCLAALTSESVVSL